MNAIDPSGTGRGSTSAPAATVVIPAHDAAGTIAVQLQALVAQRTTLPFEVVVVLNRCRDRTAEVAATFDDRLDLRLVVADEVAGPGHARNRGAAEARSDRLLFCDADDRVEDRWVEALVTGLERFDAVGGALRNWDPTGGWAIRSVPEHQHDHLPASILGEPFVVSASLGVRRDAYWLAGGFPELPAGVVAEDIAFSEALRSTGATLGFVPDARCGYRVRPGMVALCRQQVGYGRGIAWLIAHHAPELDRGAVRDVLGFARSCAGLLRPEPIDRWRWRVVQLARHWGRVRYGAKLRRRRREVAMTSPASGR